MPIHILKMNYAKALMECRPDAVLKMQPCTDGHSEGSIVINEDDETMLIISGFLPEYTGEDSDNKIIDVYLKAFETAGQHECGSILVSMPYDGHSFAHKDDIKFFGIAYRASYEALVKGTFHADIYIVLDTFVMEQIFEILPRVEKKPEIPPDINRVRHSPAHNLSAMGFIGHLPDACGMTETVHVPDALHEALKKADWEPIYYYDEDDPHVPTATQIIADIISEKHYKTDKIYLKLEFYVGRSTFYAYTRSDYAKRPSKDPLIYICLALKLSLEQTVKILNAAGWRLDMNDPIDMTYAAALNMGAEVCEMVSWFEVEGLLDAAKKRPGIKFISDSDGGKEITE